VLWSHRKNINNKRVGMRIIFENRVLRRIYGRARRKYMEVGETEKCGASYVRSEVPTAVTAKTAMAKAVTMHSVICKRIILNISIIRTNY
jgi:hypothetical protein